jgi:hypothetical protein
VDVGGIGIRKSYGREMGPSAKRERGRGSERSDLERIGTAKTARISVSEISEEGSFLKDTTHKSSLRNVWIEVAFRQKLLDTNGSLWDLGLRCPAQE